MKKSTKKIIRKQARVIDRKLSSLAQEALNRRLHYFRRELVEAVEAGDSLREAMVLAQIKHLERVQ